MLTNPPQNNSSSNTYGSGTTGSTGYGNKKFTSSGGDDTAAYSGSGGYGSGTTGGAGYGSRTGGRGDKSGNDDSNY
jgi:hypothetical protein